MKISNSLLIQWGIYSVESIGLNDAYYPIAFTTIYQVNRWAQSMPKTPATSVQATYYGTGVINYTLTKLSALHHSHSDVSTWGLLAIGSQT